jgi:hypothetical protein
MTELEQLKIENARLRADAQAANGVWQANIKLTAMVEALRKERDDALDAARQQDALRGATLATMRSVSADLATAQAQIEALSDALEELKQWADAYPTKVFPEPDLARAAAILSQGGMSLDVIAASNMRHVLTRVAQITRSALAAPPAKEGE